MKSFIKAISDDIIEFGTLFRKSLTSPAFYRDVYFTFSGYGIRYIFIFIYCSSLIVTSLLIYKVNSIQNYLDNKVVSNYETEVIDTILSNWQIFYYNGVSIYSDDQEPILIKGPKRKVILAIDPADELVRAVRKNIPIIFGKNKLLVGVHDTISGGRHMPFEYSDIFGQTNSVVTVDSDLISNISRSFLASLAKLAIYCFFPFYILISLIALFIEKISLISIVFFGISISTNNKANFQASFRLVMFSCGIYSFFMPLAIISDFFVTIAHISQLWTIFLIIYGMINKPIFRSF